MAWSSDDQNPTMAPSTAGGTNYAAALSQAAYYNPLGGGSSNTGLPAASQASQQPTYADRLNASSGQPAKATTTGRALEWSASTPSPASAARAAREIQPWGGGGTRFEIAGKAASRGIGNVNNALVDIIRKASEDSPYNVQLFSGIRPGDKRQHGKGHAVDIALVDPYSGEALANYQSAETFPQYEAFAKRAYEIAQRDYPELASNFRWGGYFAGGKGKYGATDAMHFDVNSGLGMAGGSFESGLTPGQQRRVDRMGAGRTQWAGLRPGATAAPPNTMYAGNPFGAGQGADRLAGGNVPTPRPRPEQMATAYAEQPPTAAAAPFDAVMAGAADRRPQPATPRMNPRRDTLQTPAQPTQQGGAYTVRRGDTLSAIAQRELGDANRWREIAQANGIPDPRGLQPGQRIAIPGGSGARNVDVPTPRQRPSREANVPQPRMRPERGADVPNPRMRPAQGQAPAAQPQRPTNLSSVENINMAVAAYRADAIRNGAPEGPELDQAIANYERQLRQAAGFGPVMDMADIGRRVSDFRSRALQGGMQPGPALDEAVANYERMLREQALGATPAPAAALGPGMNADGLIREPSPEERALQAGARLPLPTGPQMMDPRNAARMDMADGVYSPIPVPGQPTFVARNGVRFFAVR